MPRFFLSSGAPENGTFIITGDDAKHISFSLRMRRGEHLVVCDGEGTDYFCRIESVGKEVESFLTMTLLILADQMLSDRY